MIKSEKDLLREEFEIKPNLYSARLLRCVMTLIAVSWLLTEIGMLPLNTLWMRIGSAAVLVVLLVPQLLIINKSHRHRPGNKFVVIGATVAAVLCISVVMSFHAVLVLVLPMMLAMKYRSRQVGWVALGGSAFCAAAGPIIGYLLKTWDNVHLQSLLALNGFVSEPAAAPAALPDALHQIMFHLVLPCELTIVIFGFVMFSVIKSDIDSVHSQIKVSRFSQRDSLTGLFNQNTFKSVMIEDKPEGSNAGVIFFDIDGLKAANDLHGHEYGDLLIRRCAESIRMIQDDRTSGFRIGGDEFVVLMNTGDSADVDRKVKQWKNAMVAVNMENQQEYGGIRCSMAYGATFGPCSELEDLIRRADTAMYDDKHRNRSVRYQSYFVRDDSGETDDDGGSKND